MLELRVLGQFDVRFDGLAVELPSRRAQSLLSYLALTAGVLHRREKLAGMFWPDSTEANARNYLRQALWRIRKSFELASISWYNYLKTDDIACSFRKDSAYWLDAEVLLERKDAGVWSVRELVDLVSVYRGELLPGFYDEWTVLERERLCASFDHKMRLLLGLLVEGQRWGAVLEWAEHWIAFGTVPEPAYRALMFAYAEMRDLAGVGMVYNRYVEAMDHELGLEPAPEMRAQYERSVRGDRPVRISFPLHTEAREFDDLPPAPGDCPYKGLQFFDVSDADLFFGRERLVARLVGRLRGRSSFLAVVGASGSGKSSVVRAGLVPALQRGAQLDDGGCPPRGSINWLVRILTPTASPLRSLAASLYCDVGPASTAESLAQELARHEDSLQRAVRQLLDARRAPRLLLVVDQLEELYTLCRSEAERRAFIDNLLAAAVAAPGGCTTIVIVLRADFYAHCAEHDNLRQALAECQEYMGTMSTLELRRAIEEPAKRGGWTLQAGIVDLLLRDVKGEPGALPLLSHALLETWHRRQGRMLTLKGYAGSGGVRGAITRTAETVYNHRLTADQQTIARNIFLRLTELGEETQDTRRRVALSDLIPRPEDRQAVEEVLEVLVEARLITVTDETAEVAHEVLIREWPTLRRWLSEDRVGLQIYRHLVEASRGWEELGRDPGELYRGVRLAQAHEWARGHDDLLNEPERAFLRASQAREGEREAERKVQRQREIEAARQLAEAERRRAAEQEKANLRLRWFAVGLSVALVVALIAGGLALQQQRRAEAEAHLAASRELAASAMSNIEVDPELSILLALEAVKEAESNDLPIPREAEEALHHALQASRLQLVLGGHRGWIVSVAFSPDGELVATGGTDGAVRLRDAETGKNVLTIRGHSTAVVSMAFHPDGTRLATCGGDRLVRMWDSRTGSELLSLRGHLDSIRQVVFSPDGSYLATASDDQTARVWDASTGRELLTLSGYAGSVVKVAFGPSEESLTTLGVDGTTRVWDITALPTVSAARETLALPGHTGWVNEAALNPDGTRLAIATAAGQVRLYDARTGEELRTLSGHTAPINDVAFSPDGRRLATASADTQAVVWDVESGAELFRLAGHTRAVLGVDFSPGGTRLVTGSADGAAKVWQLSLGQEWLTIPAPGRAGRIAFSPDGSRIAAGVGSDGTVKVWDTVTGEERIRFTGEGHTDAVTSVAYSSDGALLTTASMDGVVKLWDADTGRLVNTFRAHEGGVHDVALNSDDTLLATAGADWLVKIWDLSAGAELPLEEASLTLIGSHSPVLGVDFRPEGSQLAATTAAGSAKVWGLVGGEETWSLRGHVAKLTDVQYSPKGQLIATVSEDGTAVVWDPEAGQQILSLSGHGAALTGFAFAPQRDHVATVSLDGTARLWDAQTGEELLSLSADTGERLTSVAFSPDGRLLATGGYDAIRLYVVDIASLVELAESRLSRGFTAGECRKYLRPGQCPAVEASRPAESRQLEASAGRVCLIQSAGSREDPFGQIAISGLQLVKEEYGWEGIAQMPQLWAPDAADIDRVLESGCDLVVVAGFSMAIVVKPIAQGYPDHRFQILDYASRPSPENVWGQLYAVEQGAFLAGYLAAASSRTGKVGTFGAVKLPAVVDYMTGFERGVAHYNGKHGRDVQVLGWSGADNDGLFLGDDCPHCGAGLCSPRSPHWEDDDLFIGDLCCRAQGHLMTERLLVEDADVIFPVGDRLLRIGAAEAAQAQGNAYLIGVDTDWASTMPEYADIVLTSVEKRYDVSIARAVGSIIDGTFRGGAHIGTLESGEISLSPFYELDGQIQPRIRAEMEQIKADIISGQIETKP
jgi:WD40 repeat protein/basic membrane lipoprotein Med (substrate-binding protein (PBP1-ABC) superfamily)/DNA-binding SARP family transcriptional activator